MALYLLKFARKIGNPDKKYASAQYYLGFAEDHRVRTRIAEQLRGGQEAARIVQHPGTPHASVQRRPEEAEGPALSLPKGGVY